MRWAVLGVVVLAPVVARAGGPLALCGPGQPFLWPAGGRDIPFNPDKGDLGPLAHGAAVALVESAFEQWTAVPTSTVSYRQGPELPVDVTVDNFLAYLDAPAPDGLSAIVFDDTGEIFDLLYGPGSGILGFAGPEWLRPSDCAILEGLSFLNGPSFEDAEAAFDVMVHEFGHYTNLAHTVVNGQIFALGDSSGPTPFNTFGSPAELTVIETMYPFYFGPGSGTGSPEADDRATLSRLYPEADFASSTATITGTISSSAGTPIQGVNVIARNVDDPFRDAVSAISGDFTEGGDALTGVYTIPGLTPGARYAVYVDQILAGGFSTPPATLPGPEEFHNAGESNGEAVADPPGVYTAVGAGAGEVRTGVDVVFNSFRPGEPLPVGDDDGVQIPLGFTFKLCGQAFDAVYINANGSLTFGAPSPDFSESANDLLLGPPRVAGLWDDLDASAGGVVTYARSRGTFTARWTAVPEWGTTNANTFSITLRRAGNHAVVSYEGLAARDGLAGVSCGGAVASGFENETDLLPEGRRRRTVELDEKAAAFEIFTAQDNDLSGAELTFTEFKADFRDEFRRNDTVARATPVTLPFDTASSRRYAEISPLGRDVDYYRFSVKAGDILALEVVRAQFDTVLGVFDATTGALLAADDDGGGGLLSRLLLQASVDLELAVAVSAFPDLSFTGAGGEGGRYVLTLSSYRGEVLPGGDDTSTPVALPGGFPFQGQRWDSVFVNSNGNLTFGEESDDFSESVGDLVGGPPRLAPLWDDLDATAGLIIAETDAHATTVHYVSVPEFFSDSPNYVSVRLPRTGIAVVKYGATARSDSVVGFSEGGGATAPPESDLSRMPAVFWRGTTYEQFVPPEPFDLSFRALLWAPFFSR